jgi:hypothetical protein
MRAGTAILAISGAAEERKSHAPMSAVISSIDPNEAAKALKKFTVSPPVVIGDRFKRAGHDA